MNIKTSPRFVRLLSAAIVSLAGFVHQGNAQADSNLFGAFGKLDPINHRPPDVTFQSQSAGTAEVHVVDIRTQVPDAWDIKYEMIQSRDSDVNPTGQLPPEQAERFSKKLAYRQKLAAGEIPLEELMDGAQGAQDDVGISGLSSTSGQMGYTPLVGVGTSARYSAGFSTVPDGAVAVNGAGTVVMANNTHIEIYDDEGNLLLSQSESVFFSSLNPTSNIFDPRLEYDTYNNRFILLDLHGNSPSLTELYIAISATSNPMGSWYMYKIAANPGDSNLWFDYPCMGYSEGTLTISGNMYTAGDTFAEVKVFLLDLTAGFAGEMLGAEYFDDVDLPSNGDNAFSIMPCSNPFGTYGPGSLMISRDSDADITYWQVTENFGNSANLNGWSLNLGSVNNPLPAPQPCCTFLGVSDRMMSAYVGFQQDVRIHYAFAVSDNNGDNRLFLGRVNTTEDSEVHQTFGAAGFDYAFPAIAPWTTTEDAWDQGSVVSFLRVSSTTFPEFRVTHGYPDVFDWGVSASIKAGESLITSTANRWGDYIDIHFRENQSDPECWTFGQYGLGADHGVWLAQITEEIEGCTNPAACNYNPSATIDDGFCDLTSCVGCADSLACNFNSAVTIDDGSCAYPGCTTMFACNFDASAGCDDGSCCFNTCLSLEMPLGMIIPAMGINTVLNYSIVDTATDEEVFSGDNFGGSKDLCIEPGCYSMSITGAAEDWALVLDSAFQVSGVDYIIESGTGPASFDFQIGGGGETAGCTDATACNYDADATCDNGTCCYASCLNIDMTDSYGDGWNNNFWVIENGGEEVATGTLEGGSQGSDIACLEPGCYQFSVDISQGMYSYEVGWSLNGDELSPVGLTGGASSTAEFVIGDGGDDKGCTDFEACNYDEDALCDDGSCCYDNCVEMVFTDSFGDGWNSATMTLFNETTGSVLSLTLEMGSVDTLDLCLASGCYDVSVSLGDWPVEIGWTISSNGYGMFGGAPYNGLLMLGGFDGCTDASACNYDASATCDDNTCEFPDCTDPEACNYNECTSCGDASLCEYGCLGCTYATATNFAPAATMDDGSCTFDVPPPPTGCQADIDGDGQVGVSDLLLVLGEFGDACVNPNDQ